MNSYEGMLVEDGSHKRVKGKSIIDHKKRIQLDLSMEEYAFMDYLETLGEGHILESEQAFTELGITKRQFFDLLYRLSVKGFITYARIPRMPGDPLQLLTICDAWCDSTGVKINDQFSDLWALFNKKGNRKTALDRLKTVLKKVDYDFLFQRARNYQKNPDVASREEKHRLGLDTYLQPDKERWMDKESDDLKSSNAQYVPKFDVNKFKPK